ncbi:MAG TPA: ABC transporter ATP-binding protein [bacterium]|nr:ABC transporter ATP-binding protein [bacterium]
MIQIHSLSHAIGDRDILSGISWPIHDGQRAGLVGVNGAGKTTLLRILAGEIRPDRGEIVKPAGCRIGYLPQEAVSFTGRTILETVMDGLHEIGNLEHQIHALQHQIGQDPHNPVLLKRLGELEHRFDQAGGYRAENEAKAVLGGLGFRPADFSRPLSEFSGGWRMRVYLARILIQNPDLLLLDEPGNHLDLPSLEWLEQYLSRFRGSMILVSHDRFFLDRLVDRIAELEMGRLTVYPGKYHDYERIKAENRERIEKKYEAQQDEITAKEALIARFRAKATKARMVQSEIKRLEKIERIELPGQEKSLHFKISVDVPSYKDVLRIRDMSFRYETDWIFREVSLEIFRGQKAALVGLNGAGKTTLTRLITGELVPQSGVVRLGERVRIGYYAQHQIDALDPARTVLEAVTENASTTQRQPIRDVLGLFGFTGDAVDKRTGVLSGGEKARVSLAKILLSPVNFLIMDEPTNHLDIRSRDALESALSAYDGTLLVIAHDRYFLDKLISRVIEIRDGRIAVFEGHYSEYAARRTAAGPVRKPEGKPPVPPSGRKSRERKRREAEARQRISKDRNRLNETIRRIESEIASLEKERAELGSRLADPAAYKNPEELRAYQGRYRETGEELEKLLSEWESVQSEYESILAEIS